MPAEKASKVVEVPVLLERMARQKKTVSNLAALLPRYYMLKGSLPSPAERIYPIIDAFRRRYQAESPNLEDGVRVDWKDAWIHIRASNTEPLVRVIAEAETPSRARDLYDQCLDQIRAIESGRGVS